ncbi:MAG: hypothetical protein ACXWCU_02845, partial [Caldimonas sp.]
MSAPAKKITIRVTSNPAKVAVDSFEPAPEIDANFTLDPAVLAQRRAASARRIHTVQMPVIRAIGFAIVCLIVMLQDL